MRIVDGDLHLCARSVERVEIRFGHGLTAETAGVPSAHGISEDELFHGLGWAFGNRIEGYDWAVDHLPGFSFNRTSVGSCCASIFSKAFLSRENTQNQDDGKRLAHGGQNLLQCEETNSMKPAHLLRCWSIRKQGSQREEVFRGFSLGLDPGKQLGAAKIRWFPSVQGSTNTVAEFENYERATTWGRAIYK